MTEPDDNKQGNGENGENRGRRRKTVLTVAAVLLVICLAVGIPYYIHSLHHKGTDDAFIQGYVTSIAPRVSGMLAEVYVQDNQWVEQGQLLMQLDPRDYQARVDAASAALVAAKANQLHASVNVGFVQITAAADLAAAQAAVQFAQSGIETATAHVSAVNGQMEQAQAGVTVAVASAEQFKAQAQMAQAQADYDQADLQRYEEMFKGKAATAQQLDLARAKAKTSQAALEAAEKQTAAAEARVVEARSAVATASDNVGQARAQLSEANSGLDQAKAQLASAQTEEQKIAFARAQLEQARAGVQQAEASLEQARLDLSYTSIYAPRHGHITHNNARRGQYVQVGQSLMAIVPPEVWVVANYKETDLTKIRPGQPVQIEVDAFPGLKLSGHVDSIQAGTGAQFSLLPPENASGNYIKIVQRVPVRILFDALPEPNKYYLVPGMSVVPDIYVAAERESKANVPYTIQQAGSPQAAGAEQVIRAERSNPPAAPASQPASAEAE